MSLTAVPTLITSALSCAWAPMSCQMSTPSTIQTTIQTTTPTSSQRTERALRSCDSARMVPPGRLDSTVLLPLRYAAGDLEVDLDHPVPAVKTPREAGFRMPAEWAAHAGCWMAWPCRPENWDDLEKARATYVEVARAIAPFEPVTMTANAEDAGAARGALAGVRRRRRGRRPQRRLVGARHGADLRHRRPRRSRRRGLALQRLRRHLRGVRPHAQHGQADPRPPRGEALRRARSSSRAARCTSTARGPS